MVNPDYNLERALGMAQISDLIARFAHCLDEGRFDELEALFCADASFDIRPSSNLLAVPLLGRTAIREGLAGRHGVHMLEGQRRHVMSTTVVDFDSSGRAAARSYQTVVLVPKGGGPTVVLGNGVYHDQLVCSDTVWSFSARLYCADAGQADAPN